MATRVWYCGVLLLAGGLATAAPPEVPEKLSVEPGQLVRITVKSDAQPVVIRNFKDDEAFWAELVSPKGSRQFVFQAPPKSKRQTYVIAWATKGELDGVATTITVGGEVVPDPKPKPDPKPDPTLPDGDLGLRKVSRDIARIVNVPADAVKLAKANRATASAVAAGGAGTTPASYLEAWRVGNNSTGIDKAAWAMWGSAAGAGLQASQKAGKLTTSLTWAGAFRELADGLDDAAKGGN